MPRILNAAQINLARDTAPRVLTNGSVIDPTNRGLIRVTANPPVTRVNLIDANNSSFETSIGGWTVYGTSVLSLGRTADHFEAGAASLSLSYTANGPAGYANSAISPVFTLPDPNSTYVIYAWFKANQTGRQVFVSRQLASDTALHGDSPPYNSDATIASGGMWTRAQLLVRPFGDAYLQVGVGIYDPTNVIPAGEYHLVDRVELFQAPVIGNLSIGKAGIPVGRSIVICNESGYQLRFDGVPSTTGDPPTGANTTVMGTVGPIVDPAIGTTSNYIYGNSDIYPWTSREYCLAANGLWYGSM